MEFYPNILFIRILRWTPFDDVKIYRKFCVASTFKLPMSYTFSWSGSPMNLLLRDFSVSLKECQFILSKARDLVFLAKVVGLLFMLKDLNVGCWNGFLAVRVWINLFNKWNLAFWPSKKFSNKCYHHFKYFQLKTNRYKKKPNLCRINFKT